MDGTPALRMNKFMLATLALGKADLGTPSSETLPAPTALPFELNVTMRALIAGAEARFDTLVGEHELHVLHYELNVTTRALIAGAEARFDTLVGEHELHVLHYEGYGKNAIK
jgi:carnitine O-acetyltransferase